MKQKILFIMFLFLLTGCGVNMGDRIDLDNLKVYLLENVDKNQAIDFARFWQDKGLLGEKAQYIQLDKVDEVIQVKLIEEITYHNDYISIEEEALLQDLERELAKNIFKCEVDIIITDNTFQPLVKRNL